MKLSQGLPTLSSRGQERVPPESREAIESRGRPPGAFRRAGHDTRPESHSLEDSLVRDADRLWRFTPAGIALASGWFGLTPAEYTRRLRSEIIPELLTDAAVQMAETELARSEVLLKTEQLA